MRTNDTADRNDRFAAQPAYCQEAYTSPFKNLSRMLSARNGITPAHAGVSQLKLIKANLLLICKLCICKRILQFFFAEHSHARCSGGDIGTAWPRRAPTVCHRRAIRPRQPKAKTIGAKAKCSYEVLVAPFENDRNSGAGDALPLLLLLMPKRPINYRG
jgi:hypothetical protein